MLKEYRTVREVAGPLMLVDGVDGARYDELVEIVPNDIRIRKKLLKELDRRRNRNG